MKRILTVVLALSLVALFVMPALAEVQNVKLSGDITIRGVMRDNYATTGSGAGRTISGTPFQEADSRDWYNTIATLSVDADLTDNVAANLKIGNERDWQDAADSMTVSVYSAYVALKELLYSPLTLKAGRMPIQLADGLIIGDGVTNETLLGSDYSKTVEFDTIHGILDYDPLTLILGVLKLSDRSQATSDDVDGYLLDAIYKLGDDMNTVLDAYLVAAHYSAPTTTTGPGTGTLGLNASTDASDVYALAATVTLNPVEDLAAKVGIGYQFGDAQSVLTGTDRDLKAYSLDLGLDYAIENEYSPKVGVKYVYRSGDDQDGTGDYKGWLAMFENQTNGIIFDPNTNTNSIALTGSLVPMDRLTVGLEWWWYNQAKKLAAQTTNNSTKKDAGTELDLYAKYQYTEDVSMGLSLAWLFPGDYYRTSYDETAFQAMAELGVQF
ncbi:MAG: alginate export family protein [Candidatus Omnitrophica bacterium]|nr:alginate export family protein [Candidatus Omnitrophota bacterium]